MSLLKDRAVALLDGEMKIIPFDDMKCCCPAAVVDQPKLWPPSVMLELDTGMRLVDVFHFDSKIFIKFLI